MKAADLSEKSIRKCSPENSLAFCLSEGVSAGFVLDSPWLPFQSPWLPQAQSFSRVYFKLLNCQPKIGCDAIPQLFPPSYYSFRLYGKTKFCDVQYSTTTAEKKLKKSLWGISFLSSFIMFSMLRFCSFFIAIIYSYVLPLPCQCVHRDDSLAPVFYRALLYRIKFT